MSPVFTNTHGLLQNNHRVKRLVRKSVPAFVKAQNLRPFLLSDIPKIATASAHGAENRLIHHRIQTYANGAERRTITASSRASSASSTTSLRRSSAQSINLLNQTSKRQRRLPLVLCNPPALLLLLRHPHISTIFANTICEIVVFTVGIRIGGKAFFR